MIYQTSLSGRAKKKVEELERLLEIAKKNYTQLGGRIIEDRKRLQEIRDKDKWELLKTFAMYPILISICLNCKFEFIITQCTGSYLIGQQALPRCFKHSAWSPNSIPCSSCFKPQCLISANTVLAQRTILQFRLAIHEFSWPTFIKIIKTCVYQWLPIIKL